jgi:hypothetical protein
MMIKDVRLYLQTGSNSGRSLIAVRQRRRGSALIRQKHSKPMARGPRKRQRKKHTCAPDEADLSLSLARSYSSFHAPPLMSDGGIG